MASSGMAEVGTEAAANISASLALPSISEQAAADATSKAAMRRNWQGIGQYSTDFSVVATLDEAQLAVDSTVPVSPGFSSPIGVFGGSRGHHASSEQRMSSKPSTPLKPADCPIPRL